LKIKNFGPDQVSGPKIILKYDAKEVIKVIKNGTLKMVKVWSSPVLLGDSLKVLSNL